MRPRLITLTHFFPMFPFDPPEIRKPKAFRCFQGDQNGALGRNGLRDIYHDIPNSYFQISTQCECKNFSICKSMHDHRFYAHP